MFYQGDPSQPRLREWMARATSFKSGIAFPSSHSCFLTARRLSHSPQRHPCNPCYFNQACSTFPFLRALSRVFLHISLSFLHLTLCVQSYSFPLPCTLTCLTHLVKHAYILNQRRRASQNLRGIVHSGAFHCISHDQN